VNKYRIIYKILLVLGAIGVIINTLILIWQVQIVLSLNDAYGVLDLSFVTWFKNL
jgi:TRAP-type C4-dicarboxylate transport system permease small subunit